MQVITYVKEHGSIANSEYQQLSGISKRTVTRELNELKAKNIFIIEGVTGRGTIYRLQNITKGPKKPERGQKMKLAPHELLALLI